MLRIVADANIAAAADAFGRYGAVTLLPGRDLRPEHLRDADALLVRSVTRVDGVLLDGTPVRFVGTATAGTDHLDLAALGARGIPWAAAPGSNAISVVEYVLAALLALAADRGEELAGRTLAIVGVGQVGGRLAPRAEALGMRTRLVDPPRAAEADARGEPHAFVALDDALAEADIVTLHTPLTELGRDPHPTRGLLGADALARMRPGAWLVNAARGEVLDGAAALAARRGGRLSALVLDVWPGEPAPDPALVDAADLATPHIAGYAFDGKVAGTVAVERALRDWLGAAGVPLPDAWDPRETLRRAPAPRLVAPPPADPAAWLDGLVRQAADLRADDRRFREAMQTAVSRNARAQAFAALRRTFPVRRHWEALSVRGPVPPALADMVSRGLGIAG